MKSVGKIHARTLSISEVSISVGYKIHCYWGPREEAPESIATRFLNLIDRLAMIDPVFSGWIYVLDRQPVLLDDIRGDMESAIARGVSRDDYGEPTPIGGYYASAINNMESSPRSMGVSIRAGRGPYYINSGGIRTAWKIEPDPTIVSYSLFRAALLALSETFDVTWCSAYPRDLMPLWGDENFRIAWMSYVSPRFSSMITPPQTAIVERRPNGALFMAATDETFVTANPGHLAVARDILAAIAPLNALPWPPDAEPE